MVGVDCGTNDPMVLALFAILNEGGMLKLHLCDLFYEPGKNMSISLGEVAERWRSLNPFFVVDPSASPAIVELRARGFRVEPANNKIKEGITIMGDLINSDRFTVEPQYSKKFLEEVLVYELNPRTDLPFGNTEDHLADASRYACSAFLGEKYRDSQQFYIF